MWIAMVMGCVAWGPRSALEEVDRALAEADRGAFEQVVDVDAVVPQAWAVCTRLAVRRDDEEAEFRPGGGGGHQLEDQYTAMVLADPEQRAAMAAAFRASFPVVPTHRCPELEFRAADATLDRVEAGRWRATTDVGWKLDVAREDAGWRVVSLDGDALVAAREAEAKRRIAERAAALFDGLADGAPNADWVAAATYLGRHPEERELEARYDALLGPLEAAPSVLPVAWAGFYMPATLIPVRHVSAEIEVDAPIDDVIVRLDIRDEAGGKVRSDPLVLRAGPAPAGRLALHARAGKMAWSGASRVQATVLAVRYADGREVRHPAVEAGAWLATPNGSLHGSGR